MTPDNAPTVITAAEFVSGGYAQRVAAGECVVRTQWSDGKTRDIVDVTVDLGPFDLLIVSCHDGSSFCVSPARKFEVFRTTAATPATDELASLRALAARYQAALALVASEVNELEYVTENNAGQTWADYEGTVKSSIRGIRAALAETEEAK